MKPKFQNQVFLENAVRSFSMLQDQRLQAPTASTFLECARGSAIAWVPLVGCGRAVPLVYAQMFRLLCDSGD